MKSPRELCGEIAKVLAIFVAFYLLQSQIFDVRYDLHGRAVGLAHAQSRSASETRRLVERSVEDSMVELARAHRALEESIERLEAERSRLESIVENRSRELERGLRERVDREVTRLESVENLVTANAREIERIERATFRQPDRMKERMLYPTVQLRGNGTVGSGILIYSRLQPDTGDSPLYTTFILTASHVVQEVIDEPLREGAKVREIHALRADPSAETESFEGVVLAFDASHDIALLRTNTTREFPHLAVLASRDDLAQLDVFSPAYAVGCPLGNRPMPTLGEISSKHKEVSGQIFWMLNAPTYFGNSGGGVYERAQLRLIGVSSMIYTYGKRSPTVVPHMGLFVPLGAIYDWLDARGYSFVYEGLPVPDERRREIVFGLTRSEGGEVAADPARTDSPPDASKSSPGLKPVIGARRPALRP